MERERGPASERRAAKAEATSSQTAHGERAGTSERAKGSKSRKSGHLMRYREYYTELYQMLMSAFLPLHGSHAPHSFMVKNFKP